jgi:hypothetical protein
MIQGVQRVSMQLSEIGCVSGSHSEFEVLSVARNVENVLRGEVSEVAFATYSDLRIGLPILTRCSALLAQIHKDIFSPSI